MKYKLLSIFSFIILSCSSTKHKITKHINYVVASDLILHKIEYTDKQLMHYENGENADFSEVNALVNLSKLKMEKSEGTWAGIFYTPSRENIKDLKDWYEINKENFYFDSNNECLRNIAFTMEQRKNVVFIRISYKELRSSVSSNIVAFCERFDSSKKYT